MNTALLRAAISGLWFSALMAATAPALADATAPAAEKAPLRLSEPVAVSATHETFGAPLPSTIEAQSLATLVENAEDYLQQDVALNTRIAKVCQKKGCFFVATDGPVSARVTFKDYEFFIPTDAGGKDVELVGRFDRKALDPKRAAHYAKDLGETPSAKPPAFEYVIVASSVRIPK